MMMRSWMGLVNPSKCSLCLDGDGGIMCYKLDEDEYGKFEAIAENRKYGTLNMYLLVYIHESKLI